MNYAIILAGGKGARFWPLSRETQPKQFLNVCSIRPLIEETIYRISPLIKKEGIYIATGKIHNKKIRGCLKKINIPSGNTLFEPEGKNTFAPIAVLSKRISDLDSDAVIAVLPSDHFIKDNDRFIGLLSKGIKIARNGYIVSLGIPPKRPETGYGYIKVKPQAASRKPQAYKVDAFIEKPGLQKAKRFLKDKRYYWNGGIFIFSPQVILGEIKKFMPRTYKILMQMEDKGDFIRLWHKLPCISIDYALMEKTRLMALLPADCGWTDLGSWEAIGEIAKKDKDGNIFRGKHIDIGSKNTLVWSDKRLIATLGLDNVVIVDTPDALLVCRKDMSQDVKKVVQLLKEKNYRVEI